tara:strand:- start:8371 stop:9360 length:990 start_codon:yes stop_codon:yes gene_type:complete
MFMTLHRKLLPCLFLLFISSVHAQSIPESLWGDWSLEVESGVPGWMSIQEKEGNPVVFFRLYVGSAGPFENVEVVDGRIKFALKKRKKEGVPTQTVDVGIVDGKLDGTILQTFPDGTAENVAFTGTKIPPMPTKAPDLSKVRFGHPIALFNGRDLTGWIPHEPDKINGWSVKDGMLVNSTPKTDFSATGDHANLKTEAVFEDFWLHVEFLVGAQRNSGIYLRGMYEAQVVDRDSRMQGLQGVGAIFGRIPPSTNAGKPGGEWQTYDLTLVDRHVTVVLNGVTVIDNQPVPGPTAGAIHTDPSAPGPIYIQGDHTAVSYRNLYLAPVLTD